jgi:hypothetical protein
MLERGLKSAKEQLEVLGAFDFSGLLHQLHRLVHVLLWFAAVAFDVIKMAQTTFPVYRENHFSVDFEENPMFAGVKQGSLFRERSELQEELGPRADVDRACREAPIDDCLALGFGQP